MKMNQLLIRCAQEGIYFSRRAIYNAGEKYGFAVKKEGQTALEFDEEKFENWLKSKTEKIPNGFCTMKQCSDALNISVTTVWKYCKDNPNIETKKMDSNKGVTYVNIEQLRKFIQVNKFGYKEK